MVRVGQFSQGRIVVDARYTPLIISTFFGRCDLEAATWHTDVLNSATIQAAKKGHKVITINDATHSDRPTPDARKFWAENMSTDSAAVRSATLATYVVFTSAIVRGALTAIGWLNPDVKKIETFASMADAIKGALRRLERERFALPNLNADDYRMPQADSETAIPR